MKSKIFITALLVIIVSTSCNKNKKGIEIKGVTATKSDEYTILGNIKNIKDSTWVFINKDNKIVDSTQIVQEKFQFNGSVEEPTPLFIFIGKNKTEYFSFWAENQEIKITGEKGKLKKVIIEAGETQKQQELKNKKSDSQRTAFTKFNNKIKKINTTEIPKETRDLLVKEQNDILAGLNNKSKEFIQEFPDSYISPHALLILNTTWDKNTVDTLYNSLSDRMKKTKKGLAIAEFLSLPETPKIGEQYIDFELPNTKGELVKISDIKGKYVLLEFWASWCGPCIKANPKLVKSYNKYKDLGFEIIGISLDNAKKHWIKAIEKGKLPWVNVSDLKGSKSNIAMVYGINGIPDNVLIDQNGKIIAKTLRGDDLEEKLKELFK